MAYVVFSCICIFTDEGIVENIATNRFTQRNQYGKKNKKTNQTQVYHTNTPHTQ